MHFYSLMLVTQKNHKPIGPYLDFIEFAIKSGITSVQLREKNLSFEETLSFGHRLKEVLTPANIPLIVNDSPILAKQLQAQGLHLGQEDGSIQEARMLLGKETWIGISAQNLDQIAQAQTQAIDYIGLGAIFSTYNKKDIAILGLEQLYLASRLSHLPLVAIGGITEKNLMSVFQAGAKGVAAIGAFHEKNGLAIQPMRQIYDHFFQENL